MAQVGCLLRMSLQCKQLLSLAVAVSAWLAIPQGAEAAVVGFSGHWGLDRMVGVDVDWGRRFIQHHAHRGWFGPHSRLFIGLGVPILPIGYATYWYGGVPYYIYDNVYYVADGRGYRIVERPMQEESAPSPIPVVAAPPAAGDSAIPTPVYAEPTQQGQLYAYPAKGQSETAATFDRIECETWATKQTGYHPGQSVPEEIKKNGYRRAVVACLEGRGYTVR